jgi:hypothetical protein
MKEFSTILAANEELFSLRLCRYPEAKVFDQPVDSPLNTVDVTYKFEDETSFSFLRVHAEQVKLEFKADSEDFSAIKDASETKTRLIVDFDRGLKQPLEASAFRMDEWTKGFFHLLRRDVEKVLKERIS